MGPVKCLKPRIQKALQNLTTSFLMLLWSHWATLTMRKAWDDTHQYSIRTSWTCMCPVTAEKLHCDVTPTAPIWPDYALDLPQPRLADFLSRKPGNKERQWRMSGFHPRPKSWVWSVCLYLWSAGFLSYCWCVLPATTSTENMPEF